MFIRDFAQANIPTDWLVTCKGVGAGKAEGKTYHLLYSWWGGEDNYKCSCEVLKNIMG